MANLNITVEGEPMTGNYVRIKATGPTKPVDWEFDWAVLDADGKGVGRLTEVATNEVNWLAPENPGVFTIVVAATPRTAAAKTENNRDPFREAQEAIIVKTRPLTKDDVLRVKDSIVTVAPSGETVPVSLRRHDIIDTPSMTLGTVIRATTEGLDFNNYVEWMNGICGSPQAFKDLFGPYVRNTLPFPDIISYKALKLATEAFLLANVGVKMAYGDLKPIQEQFPKLEPSLKRERFDNLSANEKDERLGLDHGSKASKLWKRYLEPTVANTGLPVDAAGNRLETLPYLALVRQQLPEWRIELNADAEEQVELCDRIMGQKFTSPTFLELIWSYWHEEGMLNQTMAAICMRFQNRSSGRRDPLREMAIDPLRPLNNLLWGYIQDEQHRLTLPRRLAEYDQEYGLTLFGRAVPPFQTADPRSRFLEAFHTLLHRTSIFYKEDDDTTTIADPFPVLNALRDVHLVLAEGANNQYGDLPWTARHEMLIQQWLLGRAEFRDFLPTRIMVVNPERWMDRVDAMKKLQGWGETPVRYFRDLARFGEQLLLSIRFGNWGVVTDREEAGNWARYWRQEVQWYIHAYQTVTGVDLSADTGDARLAQLPPDRFTQPAYLLRRRVVEQRRRLPRGALGPGPRRQLPRPGFQRELPQQEVQPEFHGQ